MKKILCALLSVVMLCAFIIPVDATEGVMLTWEKSIIVEMSSHVKQEYTTSNFGLGCTSVSVASLLTDENGEYLYELVLGFDSEEDRESAKGVFGSYSMGAEDNKYLPEESTITLGKASDSEPDFRR